MIDTELLRQVATYALPAIGLAGIAYLMYASKTPPLIPEPTGDRLEPVTLDHDQLSLKYRDVAENARVIAELIAADCPDPASSCSAVPDVNKVTITQLDDFVGRFFMRRTGGSDE